MSTVVAVNCTILPLNQRNTSSKTPIAVNTTPVFIEIVSSQLRPKDISYLLNSKYQENICAEMSKKTKAMCLLCYLK